MQEHPVPALVLLLVLGPLLASTAGCAGPGRSTVVGSPADFPGYPTQANRGPVWAQATYYANHDDALAIDLARRGVLPVALRVGVRGEDGGALRLSDDFDPHLYLQDGTVLEWIPAEEVEGHNQEVSNRIARFGLRPSLLTAWDDAAPRFLFFRFPEGMRLDGTRVLVPRGDHYRELHLLHSLLSFTVTGAGEEGAGEIHVGLTGDRWSEPRRP